MDRNLVVWAVVRVYELSLSARRAWIEMTGHRQARTSPTVALRKESVDRNLVVWAVVRVYERRSPQGERG